MNNRFLPLSMEDLFSRLENISVNDDGQLQAACPICESDRLDGHHFYAKEVENGRVLMYCHRCNASYDDLVRALEDMETHNISEDERLDRKSKRKYASRTYYVLGHNGEPEARFSGPIVPVVECYDHEYYNPDGTLAYFKRRIKHKDGHKRFYFHYNENGKDLKGLPPRCITLYNLHLLEKASANSILFIVEGEKCADAMSKQGLLATSSNTGAQKKIKLSPQEKVLLDKFLCKIVISDNDVKGMEYAEAWKKLGAMVLPVTTFWVECPEKGDVADYFEAGLPAEKIMLAANELRMSALADEQSMHNVHGKDLSETVDSYKGNETAFSSQPFALRCGKYEANDNGIFINIIKKQQSQKINVSPIPLLVIAIMNDIIDNREKVKLAFFKDGCWKELITGREVVSSSSEIVKLAAFGLEVTSNTGRMLVDYLVTLINENRNTIPVIKCTSRLGWHKENFVPYYNGVNVIGDQNIIDALQTKGSYDKWVAYVKKIRKNKYLRLLMAASFASVLLEPLGCLSFVLHLWGGSGTGKTVGMMVAASVWGNPAEGALTRTLNSTPNAMLKTAAFLCNLPFFGNELQTLKVRINSNRDGGANFDSLLYALCEGMDRSRLNKYSELQSVQNWKLIFIFNGEEPIIKNNSDGGAVNRAIEIHCDKEVIDDVAQEGSRTADFVRNNYGYAGRNFLEHVKAIGIDTLKTRYEQLKKVLMEATNTTDKQIMAISALYLADSIVAEKIFDEQPLEIEYAQLLVRTLQEVDIVDRAYKYIIGTILEHENNFVKVNMLCNDGIETVQCKPHGDIWGRYTADDKVVILSKILRRELSKQGFDFDALKKCWEVKGYLIKPHPGKFSTSGSVLGVKGLYVYLNLKGSTSVNN